MEQYRSFSSPRKQRTTLSRYVLTPTDWAIRHGSPAIEDGRLIAKTDTDYLQFICPNCSIALRGGVGVGFEGLARNEGTGRPRAISLALGCDACGFRDYFKIGVDHLGEERVRTSRHPLNWPRGSM